MTQTKFILPLILSLVLTVSGFGQVILSSVNAPTGGFNSQQTFNMTLSDGDVLMVAYGDDNGNGSAYSSVTFNSVDMTSVFGSVVNENRTSADLLYYINDTGSDITADVVVDSSQSGFVYGIYTAANVDLDDPFGTPVTNSRNLSGPGDPNETLDLDLTGLNDDQFVMSVFATGNGDSELSVSVGSIIQVATDGGGGGTTGLSTWNATSAGAHTLTWTVASEPYRLVGGAVGVNFIPEPSAATLLLGSLGLILLLRRRRA